MQHNLKFKEDLDTNEGHVYLFQPVSYPQKSTNIDTTRLWFICLLILLILDGILTYIGISFSSTQHEANILVKSAMEKFGIGSGIIVSKSFAVLSLFVLWHFRKDIIWIFTAIKGLVFVYLSFAIIPWVYVLSNYLFPLG